MIVGWGWPPGQPFGISLVEDLRRIADTGQSLEIFTRVAKVQGGCVGTAFWMSVAPDAQKHVPTSRYGLS
jgi:hypothetical protein